MFYHVSLLNSQLTCDHLVSEHALLLKAREANLAMLKMMVKDPMLRYPPQEELLLQKWVTQLLEYP